MGLLPDDEEDWCRNFYLSREVEVLSQEAIASFHSDFSILQTNT